MAGYRWWARWPQAARSWRRKTSRGMSMKDAGILDGDLLAVHRNTEPKAGQVVVARIGDEVTVKRFQKRGNTVRLLPETPDFEPIVVDLTRQELVIEATASGENRNGQGKRARNKA